MTDPTPVEGSPTAYADRVIPSREWDDYVARATRTHGDKLDLSAIARHLLPYALTGQRVRVADGDFVRTGRVSVTTGWQPVLILMHRSNEIGSWDTLSDRDTLVAVQHRGTYVPLANLPYGGRHGVAR